MKQIIQKDDDMYVFFKEYYTYMQDYFVPDDEEKYWNDLIEKGNALGNRYKKTKIYAFVCDIIVDFILSRQELSRQDAKNCIKNITGIGKATNEPN